MARLSHVARVSSVRKAKYSDEVVEGVATAVAVVAVAAAQAQEQVVLAWLEMPMVLHLAMVKEFWSAVPGLNDSGLIWGQENAVLPSLENDRADLLDVNRNNVLLDVEMLAE
jgi:hypothetical protein